MSTAAAPYVKPEISNRICEARYFYLHHRRADDPRLVVVCGGRETCAPDYEIDRATFPYYGVEWVERGRGEVWLRGRRKELGPGTVFSYGPGLPCRIRTDPESNLTKCFIDLTGSEAPELLGASGLKPGQTLQVLSIVELSELYDGMLREGLRHGPDVHTIVATYMRLLLLKIKARRVRDQAAGSQRLETFLRCRQFLQEHYLEYPNIEAAAQALTLTPSYLCRLFREHGELSPYQFWLRARMNHALEHLMLSGGCVKQACYAAGFRDPAHFSRLFKQVHGLSPRELAARTLRATRATR